jgi:hypothetical protein
MKSCWLSIMVRGAHPTLTLNFSRQLPDLPALTAGNWLLTYKEKKCQTYN